MAVSQQIVPSLHSIWCKQPTDDWKCPTCLGLISPGALIRTFSLVLAGEEPTTQTGTRTLRSFDRDIVLHHRHFECLRPTKVKFIAVSHVWDTHISEIQNEYPPESEANSERLSQAANLVFRTAINVYEGIAEGIQEPFELWHDYISVPQWEHDEKVKILLKIPDIYNHVDLTVVDMHDVDAAAVQQLREDGDHRIQTRLQGITSICNSHYLRRVWTAMEYIQSQHVRVLTKDFKLLDGGDDLYLGEITRRWEADIARKGNVFIVEDMANRAKNVLPWQVGPLKDFKKLKRTSFGAAYEILSLRGCTSRLDFWYALLGLITFTLRDENLDQDPRKARWQVLKACIAGQDYSTVFMVPTLTHVFPNTDNGFWDIRHWGLGFQISPPRYNIHVVDDNRVAFQAQPVGSVHAFERSSFERNILRTFIWAGRAVLRLSGPSVDEFVKNLGMRILAQDPIAIIDRLKANNKYQETQNTLVDLQQNEKIWSMAIAERMAYDLGFSNFELPAFDESKENIRNSDFENSFRLTRRTPLERFTAHGNTIHLIHRSAIIATTCPSCQQLFLVRAALYASDQETFGAKLYRVPGVEYVYTLADGMGLLMQGSRIVGRVMYASPCCAGPPMEQIEVDLPDFPMPSPNPIPYGRA